MPRLETIATSYAHLIQPAHLRLNSFLLLVIVLHESSFVFSSVQEHRVMIIDSLMVLVGYRMEGRKMFGNRVHSSVLECFCKSYHSACKLMLKGTFITETVY